jgi:alpha-L-fucosidase
MQTTAAHDHTSGAGRSWPYAPSWNSLKTHPTPRWFQEAKFGIYTHWGIYCVPGRGPNATWYPYNMYREGTPQHAYHVQTYGDPSRFGYKDFIPMFTAEKFDPDEWAELFKLSGARYAGPVGEHHDGFCMWDTRYSDWSAAKMGPKRDVVGLLESAIRRQGLKFLVALHHAENWWFFPHWKKQYDTADPVYAGLYGEAHDLDTGQVDHHNGEHFFEQERPSAKFLAAWQGKILELIDHYTPDVLWFDFGLRGVPDQYKQEFLAYYYNQAHATGREVAVTYKDFDLAPGCGVVDLELGRMHQLTYNEWITDTTIDDGAGWGYLKDTPYKSATTLVHYLVDNVSKNGYLLLNVGPRPDGTLPEQAHDLLKSIGRWMAVNGEAIYGTSNWTTYGEGPTQMVPGAAFNEKKFGPFTGRDIRFTSKDNCLYATCLGWPGAEVTIASLKTLYPDEIRSVSMLGADQPLKWQWSEAGLTIATPATPPGEHAYVFKIVRGDPYPG